MAANVTVTVLSLDTAVSSYYGNLCMESCSWKRILQLFEEGVISGAIAGSPCETFSAARNQPPTPIPGLPLVGQGPCGQLDVPMGLLDSREESIGS